MYDRSKSNYKKETNKLILTKKVCCRKEKYPILFEQDAFCKLKKQSIIQRSDEEIAGKQTFLNCKIRCIIVR